MSVAALDIAFTDALDLYRAAGWKRSFPLPAREKDPPPEGITGAAGQAPTPETLATFRRSAWDSNIGVAMPQDLIGIDIDQYGTKKGAENLAALEQRLGIHLPPTVRSTSRGPDDPSGIRLYRVPPGLIWRGELCSGVELIAWNYRYAVVWPSTHPEGREYRWYDEAGDPLDQPPLVAGDHPDLPWQFVAEGTRDPDVPADYKPASPQRAVREEWHPRVAAKFDEYINRNGGARHEAALAASMALARYEHLGLPGATTALDELGQRFVDDITPDRGDPRKAAAEWGRLLSGGQYKAQTTESTVLREREDEAALHDSIQQIAGPTASNGTSTPPPEVSPFASSLLTSEQIAELPPPQWLIQNFLVRNSLAILYGSSGSAKTFLAIDWALHVATGSHWNQHAIDHKHSVLYVIAEGAAGVGRRLEAWKTHHRIYQLTNHEPVMWRPQAVNLTALAEAYEVCDYAASQPPALIIFDTLARCTVGAEENSARDMGLVIDHLDRIRVASGACVLVIHHTGKDGAAGARGSSAIRGAVDTELEVTAVDRRLTLKVTKQKDGAEALPLRLDRIDVAESCVLVPASYLNDTDELGAGEQSTLEALREVQVPGGVSASVWRVAAPAGERTFYNHRSKLLERGLVINLGSDGQPRYQIKGDETPEGF